MKRLDKRAIVGLEATKFFVIALMIVAISAVAMLIMLDALDDPNIAGQSQSLTVTENQTQTVINVTGGYLPSTNGKTSCSLTITEATNTTGGVINSANYTVTGCLIQCKGGAGYCDLAGVNNSIWNITGSYTYEEMKGVKSVKGNITSGTLSFFSNSTTFFTLITVAVIILIITIVVIAVNSFSEVNEEIGSQNNL